MTPELQPELMSLRDQFASRAPVTMQDALDAWGPGLPDLSDPTTRRTFSVFWAQLCYAWADGMLTERDDLYVDRKLVSLEWFKRLVTSALEREGIKTLRDLLALSVYDVLQLDGIGEGGLMHIVDVLASKWLHLAPHREREPARSVSDEAVGTDVVGG